MNPLLAKISTVYSLQSFLLSNCLNNGLCCLSLTFLYLIFCSLLIFLQKRLKFFPNLPIELSINKTTYKLTAFWFRDIRVQLGKKSENIIYYLPCSMFIQHYTALYNSTRFIVSKTEASGLKKFPLWLSVSDVSVKNWQFVFIIRTAKVAYLVAIHMLHHRTVSCFRRFFFWYLEK